MADKLRVGILGATGAVGQNYALLLENHPWFDITYLAASPNSAGKLFGDVAGKKWFMDRAMPKNLVDLVVGDAGNPEQAMGKCDFVFSSYEGSKEEIQKTEMAYAAAGIPVVSNNSAHRWTEDVPMIIPEINSDHLEIISIQQINRKFGRGFVVTKPNCSIQSYLMPIHALRSAGYKIKSIMVTTQQAVSGAGYPGVPSLDMIDNIIPFIPGEEEKTEKEPLKIFGYISAGKIVPSYGIKISATCTRVPVIDGHTAIVNVDFDKKWLFANKPARPLSKDIVSIFENFKGLPQELDLPSAPKHPIIYKYEDNRPQPRKDRYEDKGMAVTVGRLRDCSVFDIKFVGLSHNTNRGAAGGAILTAELLRAKGYL